MYIRKLLSFIKTISSIHQLGGLTNIFFNIQEINTKQRKMTVIK